MEQYLKVFKDAVYEKWPGTRPVRIRPKQNERSYWAKMELIVGDDPARVIWFFLNDSFTKISIIPLVGESADNLKLWEKIKNGQNSHYPALRAYDIEDYVLSLAPDQDGLYTVSNAISRDSIEWENRKMTLKEVMNSIESDFEKFIIPENG